MFTGSCVAIITPFHEDGSLNLEKYRELIDWHIEQGTNAIVPCGTTGESATLTHEEHRFVVKTAINHVNGRIPVIAGAGSNCTKEAVELAEFAKEAGADAILTITPYYNKPMPEGMFQHFKAVNEVGISMVLYNVPGRTGKNMPAETTLRCARELENAVAVKEASGDLSQVMEILAEAPENFHVLSGDDALTLPMISVGAKGCISVVANETPHDFSQMIAAALEGNWDRAREIHFKLLDLMNFNFIESNPMPAKTALELMGKIESHARLPLTPMSDANTAQMSKILSNLGLITTN
jgi:4-hydroxy-tetrahydrodipicolinate synthase